jgi:hypothetical protein
MTQPNQDIFDRLDRWARPFGAVRQRVGLFNRLDRLTTHFRTFEREAFRVISLSRRDPKLHATVLDVIDLIAEQPSAAINRARVVLEQVAGHVHNTVLGAPPPGEQKSLNDILTALNRSGQLPPLVWKHAKEVQEWGNIASHPREPLTPQDALVVFAHLAQFLRWYFVSFRANEVPRLVTLLWWVENWRRTTRNVALVLLALGLGGAAFAAHRILTTVDPCTIPILRCPDNPRDPPPGNDPNRPLAAPAGEQKFCSMTILNKTGKPIRLWRYLPESADPEIQKWLAERTIKPGEGSDKRGERPCPNWYPTVVCGDQTVGEGLNGWAVVAVEYLDDSRDIYQRRTGAADEGSLLMIFPAATPEADKKWFTSTDGWRFFPYKRYTTLEIKKSFLEDPLDDRGIAISSRD